MKGEVMAAPLTKTERKKISLNQQIEEVKRELDYRTRVYQRAMSKGTLKPSHAEYQTQRMEAVLKTLEWLSENEELIRTTLRNVAKGDGDAV